MKIVYRFGEKARAIGKLDSGGEPIFGRDDLLECFKANSFGQDQNAICKRVSNSNDLNYRQFAEWKTSRRSFSREILSTGIHWIRSAFQELKSEELFT